MQSKSKFHPGKFLPCFVRSVFCNVTIRFLTMKIIVLHAVRMSETYRREQAMLNQINCPS